MSLGDFAEGGELCVESAQANGTHTVVRKAKLATIHSSTQSSVQPGNEQEPLSLHHNIMPSHGVLLV